MEGRDNNEDHCNDVSFPGRDRASGSGVTCGCGSAGEETEESSKVDCSRYQIPTSMMAYRKQLTSSLYEDATPLTGVVHPVAPYWGRPPNRDQSVVGKVVRLLAFLICSAVLCIVPLYMRNKVYAESMHPIQVSDMRLMSSHVSTVWCQAQTLTMNSSFYAAKLSAEPKRVMDTAPIMVRVNVTLTDDIKKYWGFYLLRGTKITIKTCARWPGAEVIVLEGVPSLKTCSIVETYSADSPEESSQIVEDAPDSLVTKKRSELVDVMSRWGHQDFSQRFKALLRSWGTQVNETVPLRTLMEDFLKMPQESDDGVKRKRDTEDDVEGEVFDDDPEEALSKEWISTGFLNSTDPGNDSLSEEFSSFSSSEEALQRCKSLIVQKIIEPSRKCSRDFGFHPTIIVNLTVPADGFYYFIFGSENEITDNWVNFEIELLRIKYDVLPSNDCQHAKNCSFHLGFWSNDQVLIWKPLEESYHDWTEPFWVKNVCEPRSSVYIVLMIIIPFLTLMCAIN